MTLHSKIDPNGPPVTLATLLETCRALAGGPEAEAEIARAIRAWALAGERVLLATGAIRALAPEEAALLVEATVAAQIGDPPGISFAGTMAEARDWSAVASAGQLRAILWAAYHRLHQGSRRRFWQAVLADAHAVERNNLLVAAWDAHTPEERHAFIAKVNR